MSHEMIYTSAPAGLRLGTSGFCTVCASEDIPAGLQQQLEKMSVYRHVVPPGSTVKATNPVCWQHVLVNVDDVCYSVLSRIADAGLDYQQRLNYLAHHIALPRRDCPTGNPATALMQPRFMEHRWDGEVRHIDVGKLPATGSSKPAIAEMWRVQTGDAGWAGALAESFTMKPAKPCYLFYDLGTNVLPLFQEALALLPREKQWQVTFSTYYQGGMEGVQCAWRAVLRDSVEARQLIPGKQLVIDLANAGQAPDTPWTSFARTGQKPAATSTAPPEVAAPFQLNDAPDVPVHEEDEAMEPLSLDEASPPTLKRPKKRKKPTTLVKKQLFPKPLLDEEREEDKTPRSNRQPYVFFSVMLLLLAVGAICAVVAYKNATPAKEQQAQADQADEAKKNQPHAVDPNKGNINDPPVNQNRQQQDDEVVPNRGIPERKPNDGGVAPQRVPPVEGGAAPQRVPPVGLKPGSLPEANPQANPGQPGQLVAIEQGLHGDDAMRVPFQLKEKGENNQIQPVQPGRQQPGNEVTLIPVRYHLLPAQDNFAGNAVVLAANIPFCRSIRVLGKQVFTETATEISLRNTTYQLKSFADRLRISRKEAGRTIDLADVVRQAEQLVLKPAGESKLDATELKHLKLILMDMPLLCEVGDNQFELQGFYSTNVIMEAQPRKALELVVIKQPALTTGKEFTVSLKPSYDLFEYITPRMGCFGNEIRRMLEVELATGNMEVFNDANGQLLDIAPCRRLIRLQREFDFFSTPPTARFTALVRFDGQLPNRANHVDDGAYQRALQELERETEKQSPYRILLPEVKVIAHFTDLMGKKLHFLVWESRSQR